MSDTPALPAMIGPYRNRIIGLRVMPVAALLDHPGNWRRHPQTQMDALDSAMRQIGVIDVVRYNEPTNRIWDGHLRKKLFSADPATPVIVIVTDLNAEEEAVALATHDPITGMATADREALAALLDLVKETPLVEDDAGLKNLLEHVAHDAGIAWNVLGDPPDDPGADIDHRHELQTKWNTARGQLWLIESLSLPGRWHRLLCGDSTSREDVTRVMDGQRALLFATDPPYLVDYDGTNHPHAWNKPDTNKDWDDSYHDWDDAAQGADLYEGFIAAAVEIAIVENAAWYCWHASVRQALLEHIWNQHGAFLHQQIIWVKDRPILTRSWYMWQHEPCLMGWVKGHKPPRYSETFQYTVWEVPTVPAGEKTDHPTSKPIELFAIPMQQHTRIGDLCYEPFAGSGSQFVAGEQHGRLVYGLELQPEFVAVILERLSGLGLTVRLADEGEARE